MVGVANAAEMEAPVSSPQEEAQNETIDVLENYVRMKNGISPSSSVSEKMDAFRDYNVAFSQARKANAAIATLSSHNCQRFLKLYDDVTLQTSLYFDQYLRAAQPESSAGTNEALENMAARLKVLNIFETAMFSTVLLGMEAGRSALGDVRSACTTSKRTAWLNLLMRVHQTAQVLHTKVFGQDRVFSTGSRLYNLYRLKRMSAQAQRHNFIQSFAFMGAEIGLSILAWEKAISPFLRKTLGVFWLTPAGTGARLIATSLYMIALVGMDRYFRRHLSFLQPLPSIVNRNSLSSWDWLVNLGEDFVVSNLFSPELYFAYLQLMETVERQRALDFLIQNEVIITTAEKSYGSVENALNALKGGHPK